MNHDWVNVNICGTKLGFQKLTQFLYEIGDLQVGRNIEKIQF